MNSAQHDSYQWLIEGNRRLEGELAWAKVKGYVWCVAAMTFLVVSLVLAVR